MARLSPTISGTLSVDWSLPILEAHTSKEILDSAVDAVSQGLDEDTPRGPKIELVPNKTAQTSQAASGERDSVLKAGIVLTSSLSDLITIQVHDLHPGRLTWNIKTTCF